MLIEIYSSPKKQIQSEKRNLKQELQIEAASICHTADKIDQTRAL